MSRKPFDSLEIVPFTKMQGAGNDFVFIDQRQHKAIPPDFAQMADRRRGVGCDQIILIKPPVQPQASVFMDIRNADGSTAAACGNATRCLALLLMDEGWKLPFTIQSERGLLAVDLDKNSQIRVDMGEPLFEAPNIPLAGSASELPEALKTTLAALNLPEPGVLGMGNPHLVFFMDEVESLDLEKLGPPLENHPFFPERTNVEFACRLGPDRFLQRTWERGVGETLACGSGACAVAVLAAKQELASRSVSVEMKGGTVNLEWRSGDGHVLMSGPAEYVFSGRWPKKRNAA